MTSTPTLLPLEQQHRIADIASTRLEFFLTTTISIVQIHNLGRLLAHVNTKMANNYWSPSPAPAYSEERAHFCANYRQVSVEQTQSDAIRYSPLVSLAVKHAIDKPAPQPSYNYGSNPPTRTLFGGNGSTSVTIGAPLFTTPTSQKPLAPIKPSQWSLPGPPEPLSTSSSAFGTVTSNPSVFGASYLTPNALFGQTANSQHKRHASSENINTMFGGAAKVQKLDEQFSSTNGGLAGNGASGDGFASGKENVKPALSFFSLPPHGAANPATTTKFGADATTGRRSSTFDPKARLCGGKGAWEAKDQPTIFGRSDKTVPPFKPAQSNLVLPQYGLLGFDLDNCDAVGNPEPILLNTNSPSSVFLCGSQGSGKSYTLSCMLENHLLYEPSIGIQRETIPGFVFHWDTTTSGSLAEAASLCSRGIKVRLLVSWSNYRQMKDLYEKFAKRVGGKIEVRPLLFEDTELTVNHIRNLMAFREGSQDSPLYLEVLQNILRRLRRKNERFSVRNFLRDLTEANLNPGQLQMLNQRLTILKTFSAETAPDILKQDNKDLEGEQLDNERKKQGLGMKGDCIAVERGTLTIIDLSDPFVDASTACILFDICLGIILKRHKEVVTTSRIPPGLIITLDEAHKFLDKGTPSADIFTSSLLTTIREQRHNAARVIIATQEPTISEKLLDLCSVSIIHRFSSPAWFTTLATHLGGASSMTSEKAEEDTAVKREELFKQILALQVGESLVFSPTSWVRGGALPGGGDAAEPARLGSGVLRMKTRERKGDDSGKTRNVV